MARDKKYSPSISNTSMSAVPAKLRRCLSAVMQSRFTIARNLSSNGGTLDSNPLLFLKRPRLAHQPKIETPKLFRRRVFLDRARGQQRTLGQDSDAVATLNSLLKVVAGDNHA